MSIGKFKVNECILVFVIIFLLFFVSTYQKNVESRFYQKQSANLNYLPSGTFLKGMALGYDEALADFIWVRTVGYFGTHAKTDQDFTWLVHMLKLIIKLDPKYESPYEFAGVILPSELNMADEGISFLKKGVQNIPKHNHRYWLQPFYLGFCYMIYTDDPLKAAQYFEMAMQYPKSPPYLPLLVTRLYGRAGKPGVGIDIIRSFLGQKKPDHKQGEYIEKSLRRRIKQLVVINDVKILNNAIAEYTMLYSQKPPHLNALVGGLILPFIPEEPFGGTYFLSLNDKKVLSTQSESGLRIYAQTAKPQIKAIPSKE